MMDTKGRRTPHSAMAAMTISWLAFALLLSPASSAQRAADRVVITHEDEVAIKERVDAFNKDIQRIIDPFSSSIPFGRLERTESYRQLREYDLKILPYLIRQGQIEVEGRVLVGSKLANRKIKSLEDLQRYQGERAAQLKKGRSSRCRPKMKPGGVYPCPALSFDPVSRLPIVLRRVGVEIVPAVRGTTVSILLIPESG